LASEAKGRWFDPSQPHHQVPRNLSNRSQAAAVCNADLISMPPIGMLLCSGCALLAPPVGKRLVAFPLISFVA
jgi:hypothetical protein